MDPPGFHKMKSYYSRQIFSSLSGPWLRQGPFYLIFGLLRSQKIPNQKTNDEVPSGPSKATFCSSFVLLLQKKGHLNAKKPVNCGDPLTGTERCNEKGNLLASLGG